jgi:hypothetical protein
MASLPSDPNKRKLKTEDEAKEKEDWQNASLDKAKFRLEHQAIQERARKVVARFGVVCATLKEMKPEVDAIKEFFNARPRNTVEVLGCHSFRDFCLDRLHRNESTVYKMLRGDEKQEEPKKRVPKKREREEDHIPREAVIRMRTAIEKVNEARNAKTKDESDAAWKAYDEIAAAQPLVSTINGGSEEPDYRRLTATLLTAGLYMLQAMQNVLDSGMLDKGSALEMSVKAALDKGNETFVANARRLGVLTHTVQ